MQTLGKLNRKVDQILFARFDYKQSDIGTGETKIIKACK